MVEFNVIFILSYVLACSCNASKDTFYNPKVSLFKPPLAINCQQARIHPMKQLKIIYILSNNKATKQAILDGNSNGWDNKVTIIIRGLLSCLKNVYKQPNIYHQYLKIELFSHVKKSLSQANLLQNGLDPWVLPNRNRPQSTVAESYRRRTGPNRIFAFSLF